MMLRARYHVARRAAFTLFSPLPTRELSPPRISQTGPPHLFAGRGQFTPSQFRSYAVAPPANQPLTPPLFKKSSYLRRFLGFSAIAIFSFMIGTLSQPFIFKMHSMITELPSDQESINLYTPPDEISREIDEFIKTHPLAESLRANPRFTESRPHLKIPPEMRAHSLTAGTLSGANKIVVPPYIWSERGGKSLVSMFYLGSDVSGHPGLVHGGLLATMLDEGLARCCFPALPNQIGVTANLNVDYRRPAPAGAFVVLRAETIKVEGRKAWVQGRIETLPEEGVEPTVLVEAKALFVEPKNAALMPRLYRAS